MINAVYFETRKDALGNSYHSFWILKAAGGEIEFLDKEAAAELQSLGAIARNLKFKSHNLTGRAVISLAARYIGWDASDAARLERKAKEVILGGGV